MNKHLRAFLKPFIPQSLRPWRLLTKQLFEQMPQERRPSNGFDAAEPIILYGPFCGMRYVEQSVGSVWEAKILGTYELEIRPWIEQLLQWSFPTVINVGAAEGYYSLGFAKYSRATKFIAYESTESGRSLISLLARKNELKRHIEIRGHCTAELLTGDLVEQPRALVLMDIEGAEIDLLQSIQHNRLSKATFLIELHEAARPRVKQDLESLLNSTHKLSYQRAIGRSKANLPTVNRVLAHLAVPWMDELRTDGKLWLLAEPLM